MPICKLCAAEVEQLAKAHIIPRSFHKRLRDTKRGPVLLSAGHDGVSESVHQSGLWDTNIVCQECEKKFDPYDDQGIRVLREVKKYPIYKDPGGNECSYLLQNVNYARLKLFFLSVLWRAHWAKHRFFAQVDLGRYADNLAEHIRNDAAPAPDEFPVYLYHIPDFPYPNSMLPPIRDRHLPLNFYRFYFPDVVALIVVGNRHFPEWWKHLRLNEREPHHLAFITYENTFEQSYFGGMRAMIGRAATLPPIRR